MTIDPFEMLAEVARARQESWRQSAACRGLPVDWFYPLQGGDTTTPKQLCAATRAA